jgi:hypothetical protein
MSNNNLGIKMIGIIIIISVLTFPFHWIPSEMIVVPKKTMTLKNTFVSEEEVISIVEKYYLGSPKEKFEIYDDPLAIKLKDIWKVYERGDEIVLKSKDKTIRKYHKRQE